jgi:hypothetical protein
MANWYCSSVAYTAVAQFAISHAYVIGDIVRQLAAPSVGNERCFRCTTAGTSAGSEPSWTLTKAATTTSNTATFTEVTGNESWQAAGAWAAPHARVANAIAWMTAGDNVYVAANHAETQSTAISTQASTTSASLCSVICVDSTGSGHVPPQAGDLRTTATVTTTGNSGITIGFGNGYWYGITFISGSGASGICNITLGNSSFPLVNRFDSCSLQMASTAIGNSVTTGSSNAGGTIELNNTTVSFAQSQQNLVLRNINFVWRNTASAALGTATTSGLFLDGAAGNSNIWCEGVDFSNLAHTRLTSATNINQTAEFVNCKLNASTAITAVANTGIRQGGRIDSIATDSGGSAYRNERWDYQGVLTTDAAIYAASGASDGTTSFAWKIVTSANAAWEAPFAAFDICRWNATTGSGKTVSFEAVVNAAAVLTNAQLWIEVAYFGTAASTLQSMATSGLANVLAASSNVTASSTSWGAGATARANTTAKALGDIMSVSSNTGRIFFCTTAGTTSGSLPGGYASCVDGGSVTDGSAVFRAGVRMTVTSPSLTPQVAGLLRAVPKIGAVSTTLYIDPLLTVV